MGAKRITMEEAKEILAARFEGKTVKEIAEEKGRSAGAIQNFLMKCKEEGIELPAREKKGGKKYEAPNFDALKALAAQLAVPQAQPAQA